MADTRDGQVHTHLLNRLLKFGGDFYIMSSLSPVQKPKLKSTATLATTAMFQVLPRRRDFLGWQAEMSSGKDGSVKDSHFLRARLEVAEAAGVARS